jgi:hypothetical protein
MGAFLWKNIFLGNAMHKTWRIFLSALYVKIEKMAKFSLKIFISQIVNLSMVERYFKIFSFWPIWKYGRNYEAVRLYTLHPPSLDGVQQRIVDDLREKGIAISHLDELFPERERVFLRILKNMCMRLCKNVLLQKKKANHFLAIYGTRFRLLISRILFFNLRFTKE